MFAVKPPAQVLGAYVTEQPVAAIALPAVKPIRAPAVSSPAAATATRLRTRRGRLSTVRRLSLGMVILCGGTAADGRAGCGLRGTAPGLRWDGKPGAGVHEIDSA